MAYRRHPGRREAVAEDDQAHALGHVHEQRNRVVSQYDPSVLVLGCPVEVLGEEQLTPVLLDCRGNDGIEPKLVDLLEVHVCRRIRGRRILHVVDPPMEVRAAGLELIRQRREERCSIEADTHAGVVRRVMRPQP